MRLSEAFAILSEHGDSMTAEEIAALFFDSVEIGGKSLGDCTGADLQREEDRLNEENERISREIAKFRSGASL